MAPNPVALALGYAGLIPFVGLALAVWLLPRWPEQQAFAVDAIVHYAALIVSFLGGIHWGLGFRQAVPSPSGFAWGVLPSLLAWGTLLMAPRAALLVLAALIVICYLVDRRVYRRQGLAAWLTLRVRLSVVASLSCLAAAAAIRPSP